MARSVDGLDRVLLDGFSRHLLVTILHGTERVAEDVRVESWSLPGDLGRDPKTTGTLRIVHASVRGESWVPNGARGVLSPFRATLILTEVIGVGVFQRRVQLGRFDVVGVPFAQDVTATVGARWVNTLDEFDDEFPEGNDEFPDDDEFPGGDEFTGGDGFPDGDTFPGSSRRSGYLTGGREIVIASVVEVEVESLDGRVLRAGLRSPRTALGGAWAEWRAIGLLPVVQTGDEVALPATTWPAEKGSRLDAVQHCARLIGGVPIVDSFAQWKVADANTETVTLVLGEDGTVVETSAAASLDKFANVVIGNYEDEHGRPLRAVWTAPGQLSPEEMEREIVEYHESDQVRTQEAAYAAAAAYGELLTSQEVDYQVTCVYNPTLELGDHVIVGGTEIQGVAVSMRPSDAPVMTVTVRTRRAL